MHVSFMCVRVEVVSYLYSLVGRRLKGMFNLLFSLTLEFCFCIFVGNLVDNHFPTSQTQWEHCIFNKTAHWQEAH